MVLLTFALMFLTAAEILHAQQLIEAAKKRDAAAAKKLIDGGAEISEKDSSGNTALHIAAGNGSYKMVKLLIDAGANVNSFGFNSAAPIHIASAAGDLKTVRLLVEKGANINLKDGSYNRTPLHWAARHNRIELMKYLIEKGALINERALGLRTPLIEAADNLHIPVNTVNNVAVKGKVKESLRISDSYPG